MFIHNCVRCKRFPPIYEGYETKVVSNLEMLYLPTKDGGKGVCHGLDQPITVEIARVQFGAATLSCRRKAFAYQTRFGQPPLFVTLTQTQTAFCTGQYAGVSSVETLFDVLDARMPTKAELREASIGNDCASASCS
ncbi:hypothetical protein GQ600_13282 [Phytophthora cactorum]|nr:hypothetical protein GQ600_13282 [Phytophthora cactorum]